MKQFVVLVGAVLIGSNSFAGIQAVDLSKTSRPLESSLGSAWHTQQNIHLKQDKNDITMVYGGQDVSPKPTIAVVTAT